MSDLSSNRNEEIYGKEDNFAKSIDWTMIVDKEDLVLSLFQYDGLR